MDLKCIKVISLKTVIQKKYLNLFQLYSLDTFIRSLMMVRYIILGSTYQMTWSDDNCPKGFHIFDTETRELERIINPYTIFEKIYYDDTQTDYSKVETKQYRDKFIKLVVVNKKDLYQFDKFTDRLLQEQTHEVKIVEDFSELDA